MNKSKVNPKEHAKNDPLGNSTLSAYLCTHTCRYPTFMRLKPAEENGDVHLLLFSL